MSAAIRHPEVVAMTAAMASSTGLLDFSREFPERFYDVGICEQHAVTFAAGLALAGCRPVVCIYSTFLQRAYDQVITDVAMHRLPVVFVLDRSGVTGPDGSSHHGIFDLVLPARGAEPGDRLARRRDRAVRAARDRPHDGRPGRHPLPAGGGEDDARDARHADPGRSLGRGPTRHRRRHRRDRPDGRSGPGGRRAARRRWHRRRGDQRALAQADRSPAGRRVGEALSPAADRRGWGRLRRPGRGRPRSAGALRRRGKVRVAALPDSFLPHGKGSDILAEHGLTAAGLADRIRAEVGHRARPRAAKAAG